MTERHWNPPDRSLQREEHENPARDRGVGAQSGEFRVVIEHHVKPDGTPMASGEAPREVGAAQVLPPKYSSLSSTVLEADVPEGGGQVNFELTSK